MPASAALCKALAALKATALTRIAAACGLKSTRTKAALVASLPDELKPAFDLSRPQRILTVDMGLRNLAYCLLTVDPQTFPDQVAPPSATAGAYGIPALYDPRDDSRAGPGVPPVLPSVCVEAWNRIDLTETALLPGDLYGPPTLAPIACDVVTQQFLPLRPNYVLIERQRHRSGGHAAVLEWTFRVNMLEAMLWTVLESMRRQPSGGYFPKTVAILPQHINQSLLPEARVASKLKELKVDLARDWLAKGHLQYHKANAANTAGLFLNPSTRRRKPTPGLSLGSSDSENADAGAPALASQKLDDLADCMLQGVAWVQWQANKRAVARALTAGAEPHGTPRT